MLDAIMNCGRWSKTVVVRFPERESGPRLLENMSSIRVLELLVTLVGCIMCGKKDSWGIH